MSVETPVQCNEEIFKNGQVVAVYSAGMIAMEGLVKEANRTGPEMDWHYVAGRAIVKTLGDVEKARQALAGALPVVIG